MTRKNTCGHKAGPNCIICNDPENLGNLEVTRHQALIFKLIGLAPYIATLGYADPTGEAASTVFVQALGIDADTKPDPGTVNRMCKLVVCAANTTGQMFRLAQPNDGQPYAFEAPPGWKPQQLLAAQLAVAAANDDPGMIADLLVAAITGKDPIDQLDLLCEVLFHNVLAASKARQIAYANGAAS